MTALKNSRRAILQATHTPIETAPAQRELLRGPEKRAFLLMLRPSPAELERFVDEAGLPERQAADLRDVVASDGVDLDGEIRLAAGIPVDTLVALGEQVVSQRQPRHARQTAVAAPTAVAASEAVTTSPAGELAEAAALVPARARLGQDVLVETEDDAGTLAALAAFRALVTIEPIGFLHLEKLAFTPLGIERGELVYSVPLAPGEEINIVHREWSNTSEEFERLATDLLEEFSEEGVTEKSELQQSTENQYQHASELSASVNVSGRYGTVSFAAAGSASISTSSSRSEEFSRNQSNTLTRKASRRSVKEHKITFRVASASGVDDQTVKKFKNPRTDRTMRVDYYRMMRKWSVDLLRYGVRLTYDLVVPEPGAALLDKILELQEIEAVLREGFGSATGAPWAQFPLKPSELTRTEYGNKAAQYGAIVEPPPLDTTSVSASQSHQWGSEAESGRGGAFALQLEVDPLYVVETAIGSSKAWEWPAKLTDFQRDNFVVNDAHVQAYTVGKSGRVAIPYSTRWAASYTITATLNLKLRPDAFLAWQNKTWTTIKDAAERKYYEQRTLLQQRLAELQKQLGANDTLTLRRMEREEMMKCALRWLLGPTFVTNAREKSDYYDDNTEAVKDQPTWLAGLDLGARVRFLQQAVEWENLLYIVYPYFWASQKARGIRKFLDHPDPLHRAFLRAGAARVVLTIRPGFEAAFLAFVAGQTGPPPAYLRIAEELQAFANTNYPGIRPANEVEDARPLLLRRQRLAWADIQLLQSLLEDHRRTNGAYPTTATGLAALQPFAQQRGVTLPQKDPWGRDYAYSQPGEFAEYDLASLGADGRAGGSAADADITSWAEASLVGQWFEYTPTSAIDVGIDAAVPGP